MKSYRVMEVMHMARSIGQIIRTLRKQNKMTQVELAELIHVAPNTISNYERDTNQPLIDTLCRLADVFDVSTDVILGRKPILTSYQSHLDFTGQLFMKKMEELYREYHTDHIINPINRKK